MQSVGKKGVIMAKIRPNERESIANLQRYLRQLSFEYEQIPAPPVDGIFDTATEDAVRAYQTMKRLPITGAADLATWTLLFDDYEQSLTRNTRGNGFYIFPRTPMDYVLSPNEEQFLVQVIQYILNELRLLYDDIPPNAQNGKYDDATRQGVITFQRRHGLDETGLVDRTTWNALADAHRRMTDRGEL